MVNRKHLIFSKNNETSDKFKLLITNVESSSQVEISETFDHFYSCIENADFDCLILDENSIEIPVLKLIEKLRKTKKFYRTVIGLIAKNETEIQPELLTSLKLNFVITADVTTGHFEKCYKLAMQSYTSKLIPANFKVLVIDDDPGVTEIISEYLLEADHKRNTICHNFDSAKDLILDEDFDLILTDWNLPDGSCFDIFNTINISNSSRTRNSTVVVITGRNEIDDVMTLLKHKVNDFIIKPFDYAEFEEKIEYALNKKAKMGK